METRKSVATGVLTGNGNEFYTGGNKRVGNNVEMRNFIADQFLNRNPMGNQNMCMMPYAMSAQAMPAQQQNLYSQFNDCVPQEQKKKKKRKKYYYSSSDDSSSSEERLHRRMRKKKKKNARAMILVDGNDNDEGSIDKVVFKENQSLD